MATKNSKTLATGIYADRYRIILRASAPGLRAVEEKYPLDTLDQPGGLKRLIARRKQLVGELAMRAPTAANRGTLAADVPEFLKTLAVTRHQRALSELRPWLVVLGETPRHAISRADVLAQMSAWHGTCSNALIDKRVQRLRALYDALDGLDARNPTARIKSLPGPALEPRDIPYVLIRALFAGMPDFGRAVKGVGRLSFNASKIRLRLMAWAALPPAQIERMQRKDFDPISKRLYGRPRRKGKQSANPRAGAWLPLNDEAVAALCDYDAANLWGQTFSRGGYRGVWQRAIERETNRARRANDQAMLALLQNLPPACHPYDLRHSFATALMQKGARADAVAKLLQQTGGSALIERRYGIGSTDARMVAAINLWDEAPAPPPAADGLRLVASK
jgi:integrase